MADEERKELVKAYSELQKKYGLPALEAFEAEFGGRVAEPVMASMISILHDGLGRHAAHLEMIFAPSRVADAVESEFYTEREREEFYKSFKELMVALHELMVAWYADEKGRAEQIKKSYAFYNEKIKPAAKKFLEEQVRRWQKEAQKREPPRGREAYHG